MIYNIISVSYRIFHYNPFWWRLHAVRWITHETFWIKCYFRFASAFHNYLSHHVKMLNISKDMCCINWVLIYLENILRRTQTYVYYIVKDLVYSTEIFKSLHITRSRRKVETFEDTRSYSRIQQAWIFNDHFYCMDQQASFNWLVYIDCAQEPYHETIVLGNSFGWRKCFDSILTEPFFARSVLVMESISWWT